MWWCLSRRFNSFIELYLISFFFFLRYHENVHSTWNAFYSMFLLCWLLSEMILSWRHQPETSTWYGISLKKYYSNEILQARFVEKREKGWKLCEEYRKTKHKHGLSYQFILTMNKCVSATQRQKWNIIECHKG